MANGTKMMSFFTHAKNGAKQAKNNHNERNDDIIDANFVKKPVFL